VVTSPAKSNIFTVCCYLCTVLYQLFGKGMEPLPNGCFFDAITKFYNQAISEYNKATIGRDEVYG